ncbi:MAG: hypothetical protein RLN60_02460 [Phycisphaerales bacterium]
MSNPFLHGIAIGLIICLSFPQLLQGRMLRDGDDLTPPELYSLVSALNHQMACTHDAAKKACGGDALTFTLDNSPSPDTGDFTGLSNEGHAVDITITRFVPVSDEILLPSDKTAADLNAAFAQHKAQLEADFITQASAQLADIAQQASINLADLELPFFPQMASDYDAARHNCGTAIAIIAGDGDVIYTKSIISKSVQDGIATTHLVPIEEITHEEKTSLENAPATDLMFLHNDTGESIPDIQAAWWNRAFCAATVMSAIAGVVLTIAAIVGCLNSPGALVCLGVAAAFCAALGATLGISSTCFDDFTVQIMAVVAIAVATCELVAAALALINIILSMDSSAETIYGDQLKFKMQFA